MCQNEKRPPRRVSGTGVFRACQILAAALAYRLKRKLAAARYLLKLLILKAVATTGVAIALDVLVSAAAATGVVLVVATGATTAADAVLEEVVVPPPTEMMGTAALATGVAVIGVSRSDSDEKSNVVGKV